MNTRTTHRFPIGTQGRLAMKHAPVFTVVDQLTVTNSKGDIVAIRYITSHQFCGQTVLNHDVVDTTIARNLLPEFTHLLK